MEDNVIMERSSAAHIVAGQPVVVFLVTALIFFAVGYGAAWLAFNNAMQPQGDLAETVKSAVTDALSEYESRAAAAAAETAQQPPAVLDVSVDDDPALGPEDAPVVIVEFSDFRCGYCGRFHQQTFEPLLSEYEGQIRFVYRDFPVVGGERAAMAAECVQEQSDDAFWTYHDLLFENQQALTSDDALVELAGSLDIDGEALATCLANDALADELENDFADGLSYGVRGTPAFFINGRSVVGAQPIAVFRQIIDEELAAAAAGVTG